MKQKNVVTIGGGTGSFMLLTGLKKYPISLTAIVSMADDGGSTGVLRDELGVLPPGDVRQCLVALSESTEMMRQIMNYRFEDGGLKGYNLGNLFLSALEKIKGSFSSGVMEAAEILNVKGDVIPVTDEDMRLVIRLKNGKILNGEKVLDYNEDIHKIGLEKVCLKKSVKACREAIERIKGAEFIVIGPGDHFGSIIPIFLVGGIAEAIRKSKAKVIYNCNLTNKKGQTTGYDLDQYASEIDKIIGKDRIDFVTFNNTVPKKELVDKYEKLEGGNSLVALNNEKKKRSFRIVRADLVQKIEVNISQKDLYSRKHSFIRHDSTKLAKVLMMIMELGEYENIIKEVI
jgi:uncharacterized cofD-like protein